jgi:L-2-hydroxyglutarate oxidase
VLALGREAYTWGAFDLRDALEVAAFPGFWRLAARHWRAGLGEVRRSLHLGSFVSALQQLVPALRAEHLEPAPAGIRAQAMERDGSLVDDFRFLRSGRCVHVINAPSPAATASLAIARRIAAEAAPLLA